VPVVDQAPAEPRPEKTRTAGDENAFDGRQGPLSCEEKR
jgi:hypothetical protein